MIAASVLDLNQQMKKNDDKMPACICENNLHDINTSDGNGNIYGQ